MTGRLLPLVAAFSVAALAACSSSSGPSQPASTAWVALTPSRTTVIADGVKTVTLSYTNGGGGTATVSTSQGTLRVDGASQGTSYRTTQASGTVELVTCVLGAAGCTGSATVEISAPAATPVSRTISFVTLDAACQADCTADPTGCAGLTCTLASGTGACASGVCAAAAACTRLPAGATTETSCSDDRDNDCNNAKDCAETSCDGQPCRAGNPAYLCVSGRCTDSTSGVAVAVTPARARLPATAGAATDVAVAVTSGADPAASVTVSVSLGDASLGTITPPSAVTGADGVAHFTFTASGAAAGAETITAGVTLATGTIVSGRGTVTLPRLASLRLIADTAGSVQYEVMGARGSGWQDLGWLKVQAVDELGLPYPDGLPVRFEHHQLGGSTLGVPLAADTATCLAARGCVGYQAATASTGGVADSAGVAQAWIYSGTVAGTLSAIASATAGGASFSILLPTVTVVGAKASGTNFSVVCSPRNLPALADTDCAVSLVDAPFTCEAILKDRFDNVLGRETQVIFGSEAGSVGQVVATPAYVPGTTTKDLGLAVQTFQTLGNGLPFDVEPMPSRGEVAVVHALDGCGRRTHNPRDGVVTIVAIADGEEAFFDANGDGSFEAGEPFVDLGEPFVDQDDDGVWTPGEWFLDLDGDRTWTGPNGTWDANTKIWTQTFVVYTGRSAPEIDSGGRSMGTRIADATGFVDACTSTAPATEFALALTPATTVRYRLVASDLNLNFLQTKTAYAVSSLPPELGLKLTYAGLPTFADEVGMTWRYWPCAQDGTCASQCRATGARAPCVMRPEFTGFRCGYSTRVDVAPGSTAGDGSVGWDVDVPFDRYGNSVVAKTRVSVSGSVR